MAASEGDAFIWWIEGLGSWLRGENDNGNGMLNNDDGGDEDWLGGMGVN